MMLGQFSMKFDGSGSKMHELLWFGAIFGPAHEERCHMWGNLLRSVPFVMSGHLIFNFFQTLGTPLFKTNPNNGCPKRIYPHSGQARKHFSHRFHS